MRDIRDYPIEEILCRNCQSLTEVSSSALTNALLCQKCFDLREEYRRTPSVNDEVNKVIVWGRDLAGVSRGWKRLRCARCNNQYDLVKTDYEIRTLDQQRRDYDFQIELHRKYSIGEPRPSPPFHPLMYDEDRAPKGWTNELLCQPCLKQIHEENIDELSALNSTFTEQRKLARQKQSREQHAEAVGFRLGAVIFAILFALVALRHCNPSPSPDAYQDMNFNRR